MKIEMEDMHEVTGRIESNQRKDAGTGRVSFRRRSLRTKITRIASMCWSTEVPGVLLPAARKLLKNCMKRFEKIVWKMRLES